MRLTTFPLSRLLAGLAASLALSTAFAARARRCAGRCDTARGPRPRSPRQPRPRLRPRDGLCADGDKTAGGAAGRKIG